MFFAGFTQAISFLVFLISIVHADQCALGSQEIAGNWYCQAVKAIQYSNVNTAGTYPQVTYMGADGTCNKSPKAFSGPIAPLNGEVSRPSIWVRSV